MSTSYVTGDRRYLIHVTTSLAIRGDGMLYWPSSQALVYGNLSLCWFPNGQAVAGVPIVFDFGAARVIDEATWTQDLPGTQGVWKWQASNDGASWTDIGGSFTLAATPTQVLTSLNGNTTAYRYYRLLGISGATNSSPYHTNIDFKISPPPDIDYGNASGTGDRSATITVSKSAGLVMTGALSEMVNGVNSPTLWFNSVAAAGQWIHFDFGGLQIVNEARLYVDSFSTDCGVWQWQGSADDSSWTNLGASFTLISPNTILAWDCQTMDLGGNANAYRYYRLLGISGNYSSHPYLLEMTFKIGALVTVFEIDGSSIITYAETFAAKTIVESLEVDQTCSITWVAPTQAEVFEVDGTSQITWQAPLPRGFFEIDGASHLQFAETMHEETGFGIGGSTEIVFSAAPTSPAAFVISGFCEIEYDLEAGVGDEGGGTDGIPDPGPGTGGGEPGSTGGGGGVGGGTCGNYVF
jgi:hypothetical protein